MTSLKFYSTIRERRDGYKQSGDNEEVFALKKEPQQCRAFVALAVLLACIACVLSTVALCFALLPGPAGPIGPVAPTVCVTDVDCDDADSCTIDTCVGGFACLNQPLSCNDFNECTEDACNSAGSDTALLRACFGECDVGAALALPDECVNASHAATFAEQIDVAIAAYFILNSEYPCNMTDDNETVIAAFESCDDVCGAANVEYEGAVCTHTAVAESTPCEWETGLCSMGHCVPTDLATPSPTAAPTPAPCEDQVCPLEQDQIFVAPCTSSGICNGDLCLLSSTEGQCNTAPSEICGSLPNGSACTCDTCRCVVAVGEATFTNQCVQQTAAPTPAP
jgi:hypothetical protein